MDGGDITRRYAAKARNRTRGMRARDDVPNPMNMPLLTPEEKARRDASWARTMAGMDKAAEEYRARKLAERSNNKGTRK